LGKMPNDSAAVVLSVLRASTGKQLVAVTGAPLLVDGEAARLAVAGRSAVVTNAEGVERELELAAGAHLGAGSAPPAIRAGHDSEPQSTEAAGIGHYPHGNRGLGGYFRERRST
jgi:hypothetical protein